MFDRLEFVASVLFALLGIAVTYLLASSAFSRSRRALKAIAILLWILAIGATVVVLRRPTISPDSTSVTSASPTLPVASVAGKEVAPAKGANASSPSTALPPKLLNPVGRSVTKPAVLVWSADGTGEYLNQRVASALDGAAAAFRPEFVGGGRFARAISGDSAALADLAIPKEIPAVILGRRSASSAIETVGGQEVVKAEISVLIRVYSPATGSWSDNFTEHATSSGFNHSEAYRDADEQVAERIVARLRKGK